MLRTVAIIVLLFSATVSRADQPADANLLAYRNCMGLGDAERLDSRYLWVSHGDAKQRWSSFVAVSGHLQGLSLGRRIIPPVMVLDDGQERRFPFVGEEDWARVVLFRLRMSVYGFSHPVWEKLGVPEKEPLFHVRTLLPYPAGQNKDGSKYAAGFEKGVALAPWLVRPLPLTADSPVYKNASLGLAGITNSTCPILEADNFIWQTAVNFNRPAGYYAFLNIKNLDDFNKVVGFDEKLSKRYAKELLEAVSKSGVAKEARRIEVYDKIGGRYILTKDQVDREAQGKRNPLVVLGTEDLLFDAYEIFAMGANGWWKVVLATNKGVLQDSAPDGIGYFHQAQTNDGKIHVYLTCFGCHDRKPGSGGLIAFKPFFRNKYASPGPLALGSYSIKELIGREEEYLTALDFTPDQQRYTASVLQATGTTPDKYAEALLDAYNRWDRHLTTQIAAQRYGVSVPEMQRLFTVQLAAGKLDTVNDTWLLPDERQDEIGVNEWAESYNLGQLALRGMASWPQELRIRYPTVK